jgi:hypothetical protein
MGITARRISPAGRACAKIHLIRRIVMASKQPDLFFSEPDPSFLEDRPEHVYRADPDEVRRDLMRLLDEVRGAKIMPWEPRKVRLYRTIFPQMSNWLPDEEAKQLCFQFEEELVRLEAA